MTDSNDKPNSDFSEYMKAVNSLEQALGALAESMDDVERIGTQISHSTYMMQVAADRAKWHKLQTLTNPLPTFAANLADRDATEQMMLLLAPSLVFPAATPMQIDFSGEALNRARQRAELHKENLRNMINAELRRIEAAGKIE